MKKSFFILTRKAYNKARALDVLAGASIIAGMSLPFTAPLVGLSALWSFALLPLGLWLFICALEYERQVNENLKVIYDAYGFGLFTDKRVILKRIIELSR